MIYIFFVAEKIAQLFIRNQKGARSSKTNCGPITLFVCHQPPVNTMVFVR